MLRNDMVARRLDRAVLGSVVLAVYAAAAFALNYGHTRVPLWLMWLVAPLSAVLPVLAAVRIARTAAFAGPTRRFWRHVAVILTLAGLGTVSNAVDAIGGPVPSQQFSTLTVCAYSSAVLTLLWALWRLPIGTTSAAERLRIGLDAATVLVAAAVFMWHFQTEPLLVTDGYRAGSLAVAGFTLVLELVAVFVIVKVVLSGHTYVARGTLRLFALGLFGGAFSGVAQRFVLDRPQLSLPQLAVPVILVVVTLGARRQYRTLLDPEVTRDAARRPFSVLPYLAVAAIDGLLLLSIAAGSGDLAVTAVAAVVLTGLVVWRQVNAFRENATLVERLDFNATHDALTRLPNRALFNQRLAAVLEAPGAPRPVSVALVDLDDFKLVNDTLGHGAGDALLVAVSARLADSVRPGDLVARLGGDEFVVLLDAIDPAEAELVAQRMVAALADPVLADGHELLVRASIGIADGRTGDAPGELLRLADIAMYAAKHDGGSGYRRYVPGMAGAVAGSAALGAQLRQAIFGGELFLEYQPIVTLDGHRLAGVEALVRWNHPARGPVAPIEFIPVAERTGLVVPLGEWVLREACRQLASWIAEFGPDAPEVMHVNVSARQLAAATFTDQVAAALADFAVPPQRLTVEITESAAVALGPAVTRLEELRRLGVRVSLDDFGTDQSSLTLLQDLPVDELKLDRSFVQRDESGRRGTMPAAVLALARVVGLDIVAEGVEEQDQADRLAALGYRKAQGYHFARPMPPAGIAALVRSESSRAARSVALR
ncbi:putative bifunctional diguanylate cyclase/phosphodiesterase [Dactylosporangium sp. NPDC051541]|uniref:putative bifunctional diguanylate cyclase/phosphodiesterase n=1 Tax=Dactylosporangium sp. NPDC051541 TaxID=3363977 RepID=UPI00378A7536